MTITGSALAGVLTAAEQGATILTANQRTSRALMDAYDRGQQANSSAAWRTPDILPWSAFVHRLWNDALYSRLVLNTVLLNSLQEILLWKQIITADAGDALLNAPATAATVQRSWTLVRQYVVPRQEALFARRPETAAFFRWAQRFEAECQQHGWIDDASLPDVLLSHVRAGKLGAARRIVLVGFDHFTPQQQALIAALSSTGTQCVQVAALHAPAEKVCAARARDAADEIRAAATWARHWLEAAPEARIGIVCFGLEEQRSRIDRVFLETLHPDQMLAGWLERRRAYEISLGRPLAEVSIIATALLALKLASTGVSLAEAGSLLRSPFVAGGEEFTDRARLDVELRKRRQLELSLKQLGKETWRTQKCPVLLRALNAAERLWNSLPVSQSSRAWTAAISDFLSALGWPSSGRALNSEEFQALEKWNDALSQFGSLEALEPAMDAPRCFTHLEQCLTAQIFEAEKSGAPIQIMGPLEAAGAELDALWVMGLHDGAWPSGARPDPFIPAALQLKLGLPHASSAIELEYAQLVRDRLLRSAGQVVFSWPASEGDTVLRPSPVLSSIPEITDVWQVAGTPTLTWSATLLKSCDPERLVDETGPPLAEGSEVRGGTAVLKSQAACPFMAFAQWRLAAEELESPEPGLDARQRGTIVHRALELVWKELKSHSELIRRGGAVRELVDACVQQAIDSTDLVDAVGWQQGFARIEHGRVCGLILELLQQEQARAPFTVEPEKERTAMLGGLRFRMKLDRIDRLDGDLGCVLLDYKTGEARISGWLNQRPEEPQLPAYAATSEEKLAAVAFAQLRAGDVGFAGYSPDPRIIPAKTDYLKTTPGKAGQTLEQVVTDWRVTVDRLAQDHREGRAEADPLHGEQTCQRCPVPALCRIAELRAAAPAAHEEVSDGE